MHWTVVSSVGYLKTKKESMKIIFLGKATRGVLKFWERLEYIAS